MDYQERAEDTSDLVQGAEQAAQAGASEGIAAVAQDVITLPAGSSIQTLIVDGRNLIIVLDDGSRIVVPDGAVFVPQIVVDGVVVPPLNIAQLLLGNEPEPAAGATRSSGGNFAGDEGEIQAAFDIGDLLPFTDFGFPERPEREIIPNLVDRDPDVVIETPNNPTGVSNAIATVREDGLPQRGTPAEPQGTAAATDGETTSGTIVFNAPDGLSSIALNGIVIANVGQVFSTSLGNLTVTSIDLVTGEIGFRYTLVDNTLNSASVDNFAVTVIDRDGDVANATLTVNIVDDRPIAANDVNTVPAASFGPVAGNVLANDTPGADGLRASGGVTGFSNDNGSVLPGATLQGTYGTLTLNANGTYSYTRAPNTPGGVSENFTYTIVDQDGSTSSATLTINIADAPDTIDFVPSEGSGTVVDEGGLPPRTGGTVGTGEIADANPNNNSDTTEATGGTITFTSPDGVRSVSIEGVVINPGALPQTVVSGPSGTLVVTGFTYDPVTGAGSITYTYVLGDNTAGDNTSVDFTIVVTDLDGDVAQDDLVITIVDDAPVAVADSNALAQGQYGPVTGNVLTNDTQGADGAVVTSYTGAGAAGVVGTVVQGQYGKLTIAADGSYSYTRDAGTRGGVTDTFTYTITDGDGDPASAQLVISIADAPTSLDVPTAGEAGTLVDEDGLAGPPAGSAASSNSELTSGTITYVAPDGPATVTIDGVAVTAAGQTFTGTSGTLTIDSIASGSITYTYELTANTSGDATQDDFVVRVTDQDGDFSESTLAIAIVDDVPTARADSDAVTEDGPLSASGNVLTDAEANGDVGADTAGADGAVVAGVAAGAVAGPVAGNVATVVTGKYGSLTLAADGSYTYQLDNTNPVVQGLDATEQLGDEVFTYTAVDGDGDLSTTTLTIIVNGQDDPVVITGLDGAGAEELVDEDDLASGSSPDAAALTQTGSFTIDSQDGLATLTLGGVAVFGAGVTYPVVVAGQYGLVRVTGVATTSDADGDVVSAIVSYEYVLSANTLDHTASGQDALTDSFAVLATDTDGSTDTASLDVTVVDDVPTAQDDAAGQLTENQPIVIDALANDVFGADGVAIADAGKVFVSTQAAQGTLTYDVATGLFTYTPDPGAGSNGNTTDFFEYTIVDADGDTSTARVEVTLQPDSEPTGGTRQASVDDDGLAGGNALSIAGDLAANTGDDPADTSEASFTGFLALNVGNDTPATVAFSAALNGATASIGQETVTYTVAGNLLTATVTGGARNGTSLFTVEIVDPATGKYVVTLLDNVLQSAGLQENDATANLAFTVTDSNGDVAATQLVVTFDDDAPTAKDNANAVTEGGNTAGNVISDDNGSGVDAPGADGLAAPAAVVQIASVNDTITDSSIDLAGNLIIETKLGTLTVNAATGAYTYESKVDSTNSDVSDVFTYTIRDGDGDESTATLTIDVDNVAGTVFDNDALVFEKGLTTGSGELADGDPGNNSDPSEVDASGQITVTGAAGTLVYTLLSPAGGTYGTLVLDSNTGKYTYTLATRVDGDSLLPTQGGNNGTNTVSGFENFNYEVRDTLGNLVGDGTIRVQIVDDVPSARDDAALTIAEDASAPAALTGNVMANDTVGADGTKVTSFTVNGVVTSVPQDGSTATYSNANGVYRMDMSGNWSFDPNPNLNQTSGPIAAGFSYTITDGDGDLSSATQPITITDGAGPLAGPGVTLALDDQNLADGRTPGNPDGDSDTIAFTPGSDAIASIVFDNGPAALANLDGGLTWVRVSDSQITGSDGARLIVTLTLSVTNNVATVTATLNDNFDDHPGIDADDLVDLGDVDVVATDIDGDTARSTVSVTVSDDLPSVTASTPVAGALTVDETDFGTDDTADFSGLFTPDYNADNPGTIGGYKLGINAGATGLIDTASGQAVVLVLNNGVVEGRTAGSNLLVFTVSVDAAGVVELDQSRAVKHADTASNNEPIGFAAANLITLSATVTDSDNDTATAVANIAGSMTFLDDGPALSNVTLGTGVDVDESDGFPTSDTSLAPVISYTANFGADGDNGTTFALSVTNAASGLATAAGDFPITLVQTNATTITGTYSDGTGTKTAFTVAINADGTVKLTQNVALEHLVDGPKGLAHDDTLNLAGKISASVTIKDGDNDTDSASVQIGGALVFYDDGPSVVLNGINPDLQVSDAALATDATLAFAGAFTFAGGNDGSAGTSYALAVTGGQPSGIVDTQTGNAVFLFLEAGVVVGREGADAGAAATGQKVFTVSVDASGNVKLDQLRAVDHSASTLDGANATLSADNLVRLTATITDRDGDTDSATLNIGSDLLFADDVPTSEPTLVAYLDDDALGGNANGPGDQSPDTLNLTGTLVDPTEGFGNDGGSVAFDLGSTLPVGFRLADDPASDGVLIQQEQGAGNWVTVVTVSLNGATGAYTVSQQNNVWHVDNGLDNENEVTFTLGATLTDGDNDTATTSLTIVVDDDTPAISGGQVSRVLTVDEDGLSGGIANNGANDATGEALVVNTSVTGDFLAGADDPLTYGFDTALANLLPALTSGGVAVTYVVTANSIVATSGAKPIFTVTLNATTGQFIFTLQGPVDHADTNDSENVTDIDINFGPLITATDVDGDTIHDTKGFIIRIDDDTPRANPDTDSLTEDAVNTIGNVVEGTGTDSGLAGKDEGGADGFASPVVKSITGFGGAGTLGGNTTGEWGRLVMNSDGSYTYTPNNAALQVLDTGESRTDTFTYTIEDKDGDAVSTTLIIRIDGVNDAPVANPDTNWTIEDAGAPITGNVLANLPHPGAPSGSFADVADTDVDVEPLSVTTVGTFNGAYGILTLNSNGTYSYSLYTQAQNQTAYNAVQALNASSTPLVDTFNYTASDTTASSASTLKISIFGTNDAPAVTGSVTAVSEEGLPGGIKDTAGSPTDTTDAFTTSGQVTITDVDNSTFTVTLGTPATPGLKSGGLTITWQVSPDGKVLVGSTTAGNVVLIDINNTGNWSVTLLKPIDHADTSVEDIFTLNVPVSVSDGITTTTITNGIAVTIEDDRPVPVNSADMTATNGAGSYTAFLDTDNDVDNNFGGDGGKVVFTQASIDTLVARGLTSSLSQLSYTISPDGTTLIAVKQGTTTEVFRITLDPASAQDQYVVQISLPLDATSNINFNDGTYQFLGGNTPWAGFVPNGQNPFGPGGGSYVDDLSQDLLLTPFSPTGVGDAINGNANSAGVTGGGGGQNVGTNEGIRLDFVLDLENDPDKGVGGGANYDGDLAQRDHSFVEHYDVNGAVIRFGDGQSDTLASFKAYIVADAPDDGPIADPVLGTGTLATVNKIVIEYDGERQEVLFNPLLPNDPISVVVGNPGGLTDRSYTVTFVNSGGGRYATVFGIYDVNVKIATFAASNYQALEVQHLSGDDFALTGFGTTTITDDPVSFSVPISIVDNDGDLLASEDLDITLNPPVSGAAAVQGAQSFSTTMMLADETLTVTDPANDNGNGHGKGTLNLSQSLGLTAERSMMRFGEVSTIAALSGAMMLEGGLAAQDGLVSGTQLDAFTFEGTALDAGLVGVTGFAQQASGVSVAGFLGSGFGSDLTSLSGGRVGMEFDSNGDFSGMQQLSQVQPSQFDNADAYELSSTDAPAFLFGASGASLDQSMDALLTMQANAMPAPDMQPGSGDIGAIHAVLGDIAAIASLEQLIDGFEANADISEYLVSAPQSPGDGFLDQMVETPIHSLDYSALVTDQSDQAALAAAHA